MLRVCCNMLCVQKYEKAKMPISFYRHIQLRITAIRETFEELGLLICSRKHKKHRIGQWADVIEDFDIAYWQNRVNI